MKKTHLILLVLFLFMIGCTSTKRQNYILLIDNSKTITEATLNKYISIIQETVLSNMGRYDRLTVQFIDECSLILAERIYTLDLSSIKFELQTDGMNNAEDSTKARMKRFVRETAKPAILKTILSKREERKNCGAYTDIINALNEVTALITYEKSYKNSRDKISNSAIGEENYQYENCIIIFSDMINENREKTFDFTQFGKYRDAMILERLEELGKLNKIPYLSGCSVIIYGATSTINAGTFANKQIENSKLFWQNFFHESGANLRGYAYDSRKEIIDYMTNN